MAIWYDGSLTNFSLERSQLRTLAYLKKFGNSKWLFLNVFYNEDQDEEISLLMQWNAWITNGAKNEKDIKERTYPKLLYIIILLK